MNKILFIFFLTFNLSCFSQNQAEMNRHTYSDSIEIIEEISPEYMGKASIDENGNIWLVGTMKRDYRIFGYKNKDTNSKKMILLSIFTNEVKNNPFKCKYGSFYNTSEMRDLRLKYVATENDFLKINIIKNGEVIDYFYMLKKWFEFEN